MGNMEPGVRNTIITLALIALLAGGLYYSAHDRQQEISTQRVIEAETKRAAAMVALNGLIALNVELFFKDPHVIKILEENNFRANVIHIG